MTDTGSGDVSLDAIPLHSSNLLTVLDPTGRIKYESPAIERLYGYHPEELIGHDVSDYFHPNDRERVTTAFEAIVTGDSDTVKAVEYRHKTADGSYCWVESVAAGNPTPDGNYVINTRDISDRRARTRALERTRDLLSQTERIADVGGWEIHPDTREVFWTEHLFDILGVDADEEPPFPDALDLYHDDDRPRVEAAVDRALAAGEPFDIEVRLDQADGEPRWLRVQGSPTVADDEVIALRGAVQDITERKIREQTLEHQNDRLEEFANVVSHDLRSPLTVAEGRLELVKDESDSDQLAAIEQAHSRMRSLIDDLLAVAQTAGSGPECEPIDLAAITAECWESVETADADLEIDVDRTIHADERRLKQVFENLYRNAIEHGGEDVTVTISGLPDGFSVEDTGPGIQSAIGDNVFDPSYSSHPDGIGLGLSIVMQVVDAHGWNIDLTEGAAGGARIEITGVERVE